MIEANHAVSGQRPSLVSRHVPFVAYPIAAIVAVAPLPFGSNLPVAWIAWAIATGILAIGVGSVGLLVRQTMTFPRQLLLPMAFYLLFCAALVLQIVPWGGVPLVGPGGEALTSVSISLAPGATTLMLLRWGTYGVLFLLTVPATVGERATRFMMWSLFMTALLYAVVGIYSLVQGDTILGIPKWAYLGSATSSFVNRNSFATFLAIGMTIGAALLAEEARQSRQGGKRLLVALITTHTLFVLAAVLTVAGVLIATQSRMGVMAGVAGVATVVLASAVHSRAGAARVVLTIVGLLAVSVALLALFGEALLERVGALGFAADDRLSLYTQVWEMIHARPLTGYGGGAFEVAFPLFHQPSVSTGFLWDKTHSSYLALWVDLGLVAGTLPMLIIASIGVYAVVLIARRRGSGLAPIAALGAIVVVAVHSTVDFSLEIQSNAILLTVILAMVISTAIRYEK